MAPQKADPTEPRDASTVSAIAAAALGLGFAVIGLAIDGPRTALSVLLGAAIAVANMLTLRAIVRALIVAPDGAQDADPPNHAAEGKRGAAAWGGFAVLKILVLFGGMWLLLTRGLVDPIPLVIGYGVLPLGIAASAFFSGLRPRRR